MMKFPGPIHEGSGEMQIILDAQSSKDQQNAMQSIIYGKETEPMATAFAMYVSMMTKIHDPLIKNIDLDINIETRICNLKAEDIITTKTEPIKILLLEKNIEQELAFLMVWNLKKQKWDQGQQLLMQLLKLILKILMFKLLY